MAGTRADWDSDLTKAFLHLCIAEKEKLNYNSKKGLTKAGWQNLYRDFRQQTGRFYDKKQLQNKFNSLKRLYRVWKKLKSASGGGWDNRTGTITMEDEWWDNQIAEDQLAENFRKKPLPHQQEMDILFGGTETEDGNLFCSGGTGDRTPSNGSDDSPRSAGRATRGSGKDQVVDSPPPKRPRSVEYYVKQISESMLERSRNESSSKSRDQNELKELLRIVEEDGVSQGSELYYIAAELFRSPDRRATFQTIRDPQHRIGFLEWTWTNCKKK